jgi:alginate O-acetyltransferase complex protein AlgJ
MKIKARLFIFFALLIMAIMPAINYSTNTAPKKDWKERFSKTELYNFDSVLTLFSQRLYPFGISVAPDFVTVGRDSWLYLGDAHEQSLTRQRSGFAQANLSVAEIIASKTTDRAKWTKNNGVSEFIILVAPDKSTIYSDYLPNWAKPVPNTFTDSVIRLSSSTYHDTRDDFRAARKKYSEPLYFKTDTHWNNLGGWVAYRSLAQRMASTQPELQWFTDSNIKKSVIKRDPGDLANFLRGTKNLADFQVVIDIDKVSPQVGEHYFKEIAESVESKNLALFTAQKLDPLILITSKTALNSKRLLWLHDSFGFAMEPFVYGTFTEVLQGSYLSMNEARLKKIITEFRPDYVIISVVERRIATDFFVK